MLQVPFSGRMGIEEGAQHSQPVYSLELPGVLYLNDYVYKSSLMILIGVENHWSTNWTE